jgi:hypothetical protein
MGNGRQTARVLASAAMLTLLVGGCSQKVVHANAAGTAPALNEGGTAHIRGVSDPNAQFTLISREPANGPANAKAATANVQVTEESPGEAPCRISDLELYETAASMNGDARTLTLALKNRGTSVCRISGHPAITLEDEGGMAVGGIVIGEANLSGSSGAAVHSETASSSPAVAAPVVDVRLPPDGAASFDIQWTSGEGCPVVSRLRVRPSEKDVVSDGSASDEGNTEGPGFITVNRPLKVCGGRVVITALRVGGA